MIAIENRSGKRAYETVAERVRKFRERYPVDSGWRLVTEVLFPKDDVVLCRATIIDPDGRLVASGTAEETRGSSYINRTSAVENAETSAIGRALFAAGFGGGEFCSADELLVALKRQEELLAAEVAASQKAPEQYPSMDGPEQTDIPTASARPARARKAPAPDEHGGEITPVLPHTFGLPDDCGIAFVKDGNIIFARDQEKGATYNNKELLKNAGFSFDGQRRVWFKEVEETVA